MLYYPLPRLHLLPGRIPQPPRGERAGLPPGPLPCFACEKCHKVQYQSGCNPNYWNEIVTYLSGGLLYGYEVKRPEGFASSRKIAYTPRVNHAPPKLRTEVGEQLLAGRTIKQIAIDLGQTLGAIRNYASQAYKEHGVHSRGEFLQKHGRTEEDSAARATKVTSLHE